MPQRISQACTDSIQLLDAWSALHGDHLLVLQSAAWLFMRTPPNSVSAMRSTSVAQRSFPDIASEWRMQLASRPGRPPEGAAPLEDDSGNGETLQNEPNFSKRPGQGHDTLQNSSRGQLRLEPELGDGAVILAETLPNRRLRPLERLRGLHAIAATNAASSTAKSTTASASHRSTDGSVNLSRTASTRSQTACHSGVVTREVEFGQHNFEPVDHLGMVWNRGSARHSSRKASISSIVTAVLPSSTTLNCHLGL